MRATEPQFRPRGSRRHPNAQVCQGKRRTTQNPREDNLFSQARSLAEGARAAFLDLVCMADAGVCHRWMASSVEEIAAAQAKAEAKNEVVSR